LDIGRALQYALDDPDWQKKLAIVGALSFTSLVLMPLLFLGLVPLAILLGYALDIINNVRDGKKIILPAWKGQKQYEAYMKRGFGLLPAFILYNLPLLLMSCCLFVLQAALAGRVAENAAVFSTLCCLVPLTLIYIGFTWPMMALATGRYARGESATVYSQLIRLSDQVGQLGNLSAQWVLASLLVNAGLLLVNIVPVFGQIVYFALLMPVQAHLVGQYVKAASKQKPAQKNKAVQPG
jgi:hypothetical protein